MNAIVKVAAAVIMPISDSTEMFTNEFVGDETYWYTGSLKARFSFGDMPKRFGLSVIGEGQDAVVRMKTHMATTPKALGTLVEVVSAIIINATSISKYEDIVVTPKGTAWANHYFYKDAFNKAANDWFANQYAEMLKK
jgi:hypothetical protein